MNRRQFVQRTGAALGIAALGLQPNRAAADPDTPADPNAPPPRVFDPTVYSFDFGGTEAMVILDGAITFPQLQPFFAPEATPAQVEEAMARNFLPSHAVTMSINVLAVKMKSGLALFDAGAGPAFGAAAGHVIQGLARAGFVPKDVTTIFSTHAHPDHICGLTDQNGNLQFPAAKVIMARPEVEFWTADAPDLSGLRTAPEMTAGIVKTIKGTLAAVKPQTELRGYGTVAPGVEMIASPGHTPGHAMYKVTSGDQQILVVGDTVHVYALQFPHPEWTMAFDTSPPQAVATRRKMLSESAASRTLLMSYHLPYPGLGHARTAGAGFEWVPKPWA
jgi:glyoxylase-like metal-dependent hydrolase (beta-lactamase superfamily II)